MSTAIFFFKWPTNTTITTSHGNQAMEFKMPNIGCWDLKEWMASGDVYTHPPTKGHVWVANPTTSMFWERNLYGHWVWNSETPHLLMQAQGWSVFPGAVSTALHFTTTPPNRPEKRFICKLWVVSWSKMTPMSPTSITMLASQ